MSGSVTSGLGRKSYLGDIRTNWRFVLAAAAGLGSGTLLNHYTNQIFAPHLLNEFGWSRAEFAMIGALSVVTLAVIPIVGRLTDLLGVRMLATIGVISLPLSFIAFSMMSGDIKHFFIITVAQNVLCGTTTTSTVYSRLIVARVITGRGLALSIAASTPAVAGMIGSPLLEGLINAHGWRIGYLAVAAYVAIVGAAALMLIPGQQQVDAAQAEVRQKPRRAITDYAMIARSRAFWVIGGGMVLTNLIFPLQYSQMKLMLLEMGVGVTEAAWMISLFAGGVMAGRFFCGLALDRFEPHVVSAICMGFPGVGLLAIAFGFHSPVILLGAVLFMGISIGAESDLAAFLAIRFFALEIYGTVISLIVLAIGIAAALGSVLLSVTLAMTGNFNLFLLLGGICSLSGGLLFLLLGQASVDRGSVGEASDHDIGIAAPCS